MSKNITAVFDVAVQQWRFNRLGVEGLNNYFVGAFNACNVLIGREKTQKILCEYYGIIQTLNKQLNDLGVYDDPVNKAWYEYTHKLHIYQRPEGYFGSYIVRAYFRQTTNQGVRIKQEFIDVLNESRENIIGYTVRLQRTDSKSYEAEGELVGIHRVINGNDASVGYVELNRLDRHLKVGKKSLRED
ncbi:hypothetical protein [Beggiatoa leptomitoformis]|uniref:Uncharacterized protein n=1 Tax=Beggiatoa leptomitoformis TaxID=288004 RepID=A0A2N9YCX1_9GAMM|nr:hypothetical protein [Beggiatoa leptomitoformis]ALG66437.1 hypothetical protein AL038_00140 [Beggiatoa leptomitoformis]AUI68284.1 hypothetical protein BLE401_05935 [Beggiatoa leptomitoformis]